MNEVHIRIHRCLEFYNKNLELNRTTEIVELAQFNSEYFFYNKNLIVITLSFTVNVLKQRYIC